MLHGCDVSFYQDDDQTVWQIDFQKMRQSGAHFVIIRAGQNVSRDPDWRYNWGKAGEAGLLRGAYWIHDYRQAGIIQARSYVEVLRSYPCEIPAWWDLEYVPRWGGRPLRSNLLPALKDALSVVEDFLQRKPVLYTNPDMLLNILRPVPDWLVQYPLAIAHYKVQAPDCGPWLKWHFWQYTNKGSGALYGVESAEIDLDWWNGDEKSLREWCGLDQPETVSLPEWAVNVDAWARGMGFNGPRPAV